MKRYVLERDEDSHWYLIPIDKQTEFQTLCSDACESDDFDAFELEFGSMRINGPQDLSFTNPRDSDGNDLR